MAADGSFYPSQIPGALGGYSKRKIFGRLDCKSALRALSQGGYERHRVFFADEVTARAAGYRPCAKCLPEKYEAWKLENPGWATKGSQRWLQVAVNRAPEVLNRAVREAMGLEKDTAVDWLSPLEKDRFVEYRDEPALARLGIAALRRPLRDFWPARGPVWDGLARTASGDLLLVEAKAHVTEMVSSACGATEPALSGIRRSVQAARDRLAPASTADWAGTFYQYTNRLAHLHFLRVDNDVPARLVHVCFLNASDVEGPATKEAWEAAVAVVEAYLGLGRHKLQRYVHHAFVDVKELEPFVPQTGAEPSAQR
jgi:hypothetical protein